jgi:lipopolysaccharide export system permease protein
VTLAALLLERTLRLLEIVSSHSGPLEVVFSLAVYLAPHYLGLALPAAFFVSLFIVIARFDAGNELVILSGAGLSLYQITRPLIAIGVLFSIVSAALFGFIQPYSRYVYREVIHFATTAGWNVTLNERVFATLGDGVFIRERLDDVEVVTTADRGLLRVNDDHRRLQLLLVDGVRSTIGKSDEKSSVTFSEFIYGHDFDVDNAPFRDRGEDSRELTLAELWRASAETTPEIPRTKLIAEFHARLARALSLPLLPLLAVSMGIAAKRSNRGAGIVVGGIILVLFHHLIQLGESLVDNGGMTAGTAIWAPFALFAIFCMWMFSRSNSSLDGSPFNAVFALIDGAIAKQAKMFRHRRETRA